MPLTREILEKKEAANLKPFAVKSRDSLGRKFPEKEDKYRLCFQKDKERVIHSKAFRRLDEKTQVFVSGAGDHYRTRLTHTLEVAQISRDIARRLSLNEDLCEVIALAHDLGHPPFGHAGEETIDEMMKEFGLRFEHNEQSRRVVEFLEKSYPGFDGLNLSYEVLEGLIKHKTPWDQQNTNFKFSPHLEAQVVNAADEIAYTCHDIDDGLRSGLISLPQIAKLSLWILAKKNTAKKYARLPKDVLVQRVVSTTISILIEDFCLQTEKNIKKFKIKSLKDIKSKNFTIADFGSPVKKMLTEMRKFLYKNFYFNKKIVNVVTSGKKMIKTLFLYYVNNPQKFPKKIVGKENFIIAVKDYVAGMTDSFLLKQYESIYNDRGVEKFLKIIYGLSEV